MKTIKITFFNPITIKKRTIKFICKWDYANHCWEVTTIDYWGESTRKYSAPIENLVKHCIECLTRKDEYVTVKYS